MIVTIVLISISMIITFFMYCIIVGGNMNKSDEERKMEDEEQIEYLKNIIKEMGENKMERIFIDREWCITYALLAIDSIENSANKERSIEDFIKEIEVMFDIHKDAIEMQKIRKKLLSKYKKNKLQIV